MPQYYENQRNYHDSPSFHKSTKMSFNGSNTALFYSLRDFKEATFFKAGKHIHLEDIIFGHRIHHFDRTSCIFFKTRLAPDILLLYLMAIERLLHRQISNFSDGLPLEFNS
jgi:hypothetical protein